LTKDIEYYRMNEQLVVEVNFENGSCAFS